MDRRKFFKVSSVYALGAAMAATVSNTACWLTQNLFNQILAYVAVGLQAFNSVVDLLAGSGVIVPGEGTVLDAVIVLVKAGFADLQTAVQNYNNAPADQKATLLGKISTAIADVQASLQQFWNDLHIPDPQLGLLVKGLLGIILSTLAGFASSLPPAVAPLAEKRMKALRNVIPVTPKKRSAKEFKADFNAQLSAAGKTKYQVR